MVWHGQDQIGQRTTPTSDEIGQYVLLGMQYAPTFFGVKLLFFASCRAVLHVMTNKLVSNWKVMCRHIID